MALSAKISPPALAALTPAPPCPQPYVLDAVNVPVQLISKNLGDVNYQITNLENNEILLDFNEDENLFYDGIKYNLNLHMPKIYKNFLLGFKFKIKDTVSKDFKTILNKEVFKVK